MLELRERVLSLHDAARPLPVLLAHELVQVPRLVDVPRRVRDRNGAHLAVPGKAGAELELLDRRDVTLRLRDQLLLAQPPGRLRRADEPLRVLRAHVAVDAEADGLGAELRDCIARIDALGAALVAEVAASRSEEH